MSHLRILLARRALPVSAAASVVAAHGGLDCLLLSDSLSPHQETAPRFRRMGGTSVKH